MQTYPRQRELAQTQRELRWIGRLFVFGAACFEAACFEAACFGAAFAAGGRDVDGVQGISRNAGTVRWPKPTRRTTRLQASRNPSWHLTPLSTGQNRTDR
jgi:hypothetical protein